MRVPSSVEDGEGSGSGWLTSASTPLPTGTPTQPGPARATGVHYTGMLTAQARRAAVRPGGRGQRALPDRRGRHRRWPSVPEELRAWHPGRTGGAAGQARRSLGRRRADQSRPRVVRRLSSRADEAGSFRPRRLGSVVDPGLERGGAPTSRRTGRRSGRAARLARARGRGRGRLARAGRRGPARRGRRPHDARHDRLPPGAAGRHNRADAHGLPAPLSAAARGRRARARDDGPAPGRRGLLGRLHATT